MKRSSSSSRVSSGRSSSSMGRSSSSSSVGRSSSSGSFSSGSRGGSVSPFGILVLFIIVIILVVGYVALTMDWRISLFLFIGSVAGIVINAVIGKPELTPEDKLRESTITQFQIPNTKEALLEFTILATQKIKPVGTMAKMFTVDGKRQDWLNKVWTQKCNTIYAKACIAMKDDTGSLKEITRLMAGAGIKV